MVLKSIVSISQNDYLEYKLLLYQKSLSEKLTNKFRKSPPRWNRAIGWNHASTAAAKANQHPSHELQQLEQRIAYTDDKIKEKVYALWVEWGGSDGCGGAVKTISFIRFITLKCNLQLAKKQPTIPFQIGLLD